MKFAIVSTHSINGARFSLNPEREDGTSFLSWVWILSGFHFNFKTLMAGGPETRSFLKDFDLVMFSGHPSHIVDIITMARELKDSDTVTMFYPEGSAQLYDNSIRGFHREYYDAWNACDILSIAEEDKAGYYKKFVTNETLVRFVHVPVTTPMATGRFVVPRRDKRMDRVLVYGDNNPNHPLVAMACAREIGAEVLAVECGGDTVAEQIVSSALPGLTIFPTYKLSQNELLRQLGRTGVHFYPTEWYGTARQVISCAAVGTPCIGPRQSHTQMRLFPALATDSHWDVDAMVELARGLIENEKYYDLIANRALEEIQFYNVTNTRARMVEALESAKRNKAERVPR